MSYAHAEFRTLVHNKGYRLTPQRQIILDAVREFGDHCTPEAVYERVLVKNSVINRATVYRTLEFLLKLGLVTVAHLQENQVVYEIADHPPHHHFVCQQCQHVKIIDHQLVVPFFQQLKAHMGVTILTDHLVLFGLCPQCSSEHATSLS